MEALKRRLLSPAPSRHRRGRVPSRPRPVNAQVRWALGPGHLQQVLRSRSRLARLYQPLLASQPVGARQALAMHSVGELPGWIAQEPPAAPTRAEMPLLHHSPPRVRRELCRPLLGVRQAPARSHRPQARIAPAR